MESVIKWKTGMPTEMGRYIITKCDGVVKCFQFCPKEAVDVAYFSEFVVAWCPLSDIEPYKEEKKEGII